MTKSTPAQTQPCAPSPSLSATIHWRPRIWGNPIDRSRIRHVAIDLVAVLSDLAGRRLVFHSEKDLQHELRGGSG